MITTSSPMPAVWGSRLRPTPPPRHRLRWRLSRYTGLRRSFHRYLVETRGSALLRPYAQTTGSGRLRRQQQLHFLGLESPTRLKPCLVNARNMKNVPGKRTDWHECQWLQFLHSVGLLRPGLPVAWEAWGRAVPLFANRSSPAIRSTTAATSSPFFSFCSASLSSTSRRWTSERSAEGWAITILAAWKNSGFERVETTPNTVEGPPASFAGDQDISR
jgi:hypothetical protein